MYLSIGNLQTHLTLSIDCFNCQIGTGVAVVSFLLLQLFIRIMNTEIKVH